MAADLAFDRPDIDARTTRKVQARIIPFVFVLFVINYIDRVNIGFAALTMNRELAITSQQYGFIAGIFFLGYFLFEVPSNLLLHRLGARVWIARILITWGAVAILTGFAKVAFHWDIVVSDGQCGARARIEHSKSCIRAKSPRGCATPSKPTLALALRCATRAGVRMICQPTKCTPTLT
jgi:MFS family permease